MEDIIMNSGHGVPSLYKLKNNYKKIDNISDVEDSILGKEVVVIYKYNNKLFGNWHQDVLYQGILSNKPGNSSLHHDKYIWLKDDKQNKLRFIRKTRFSANLELFILN
jgi:hypothetical protein